jgi:hypothetical protein
MNFYHIIGLIRKLFIEYKFFIFPIGISFLLIYTAGCNDNNVIGPVNNNVTFEMKNQPGTQGGTQFLCRPSVNVKITEVISSLPPFYDTVISSNPAYVYSKDTFYIINEFNGVQQGQQWSFQFYGSYASNNAGYIVTTNYTVR